MLHVIFAIAFYSVHSSSNTDYSILLFSCEVLSEEVAGETVHEIAVVQVYTEP